MARNTWRPRPARKVNLKAPESVKVKVQQAADALIQSVLKPRHVKPPPKNPQFNYIVDIYSKWHRSYFYFCAAYRCPAPDRLSEFFESRFARLEYAGNDTFNLSCMRHTGQWIELFINLTLEDCLESIKSQPHYLP